jgi:hypothetical protein
VNLLRGPGRIAVATGAVCLLSSFAAPRVAAAAADAFAQREAPRRVVLDVGDCPQVSAPAVRRIVAIEIGDLLVDPGEPASGDTDRLAIACQGAVARVQAEGPGRPRQLARTLPLDDFPGDAAPRALALAAIEMLAALSPDVRERIESRQKPRAPASPPPPAPLEPTPARGPTSFVVASAVHRAFLVAHGASAWGGRLALEHELGARWELGADGELAGGTTSSPLGDVTARLVSAGAFLGVHGGGARITGGLALGGRVGGAWLAGHPADAGATVQGHASRAWGGPLVSAHVRAALDRVALQLGAELGFDLGSAKGSVDGLTAVAVGGPWLALTAGLGLRF